MLHFIFLKLNIWLDLVKNRYYYKLIMEEVLDFSLFFAMI